MIEFIRFCTSNKLYRRISLLPYNLSLTSVAPISTVGIEFRNLSSVRSKICIKLNIQLYHFSQLYRHTSFSRKKKQILVKTQDSQLINDSSADTRERSIIWQLEYFEIRWTCPDQSLCVQSIRLTDGISSGWSIRNDSFDQIRVRDQSVRTGWTR